MFYKATAQAVLLFGSETWKLTSLSLKSLEGFHIQAVHRMAGKMPTKNSGGTWTYLLAQGMYSKRWDYGRLIYWRSSGNH